MKLSTKSFLGSIAIVAGGTVGAHAITMALAPAVTRLYGPDAFGVLGTFNAVLAVLTPAAALSLPMAMVIADDASESTTLSRLAASAALITSAIVAVALLLAGDGAAKSLSLSPVQDYMLLLPLTMIATAFTQIARHRLIREQAFDAIATRAVAHSAIVNGSFVAIGLFYPYALTLILITVGGQALYAWLLSRASGNRAQVVTDLPLGQTLRKYKDFPLYRAPQDFINATSQSMPVIFMASLFGTAPAGLYALAKMVMGVPSALIGSATRDVLYPRMAELGKSETQLDRLIVRSTTALALLGAGPFLLVVAFGPGLFELVFGNEWTKAGEYARWLAPFFFTNLINKPCVAAIPVLGLQRGLLLYEIASTGSKLGAMIAAYLALQNDVITVAAFSIVGTLAYVTLIVWVVLSARAGNGSEHETD